MYYLGIFLKWSCVCTADCTPIVTSFQKKHHCIARYRAGFDLKSTSQVNLCTKLNLEYFSKPGLVPCTMHITHIWSMHNSNWTMHNVQYTHLNNAHCKMHNTQCTHLNAHCTMQNAQCKLDNPQCTLHTFEQCTLQNANYTKQIAQCTRLHTA